ncbi:hypothetical protein [Streptomyces silvensis]|uniref:Uncharacterized protein n=1 Tax=Streptomyces silvensis TaxID=1765722 RepID=A0A0W7X2J3_9ACTN|nr:hypothetical protein [Streptomyces silvensis]KUF16978.1 hypothetical protein AT728_24015 [Streptomyces silvensis]
MSSADHIAAIDLLRARGFPEEPGRSELGYGGPGFHVAELSTQDQLWDDDGTAHEETEEQYEAERDALTVLLAERWGEPQHFSLAGVQLRAMAREAAGPEAQDAASSEAREAAGADPQEAAVPDPWATLSESVPDLHLWRADEHWIALGVARWGERRALQLVAVVTEVDPP